jgi:aminopeptidase N
MGKKILFLLIGLSSFDVFAQLLDDVEQCSTAKTAFFSKNKNARLLDKTAFPGDANIDVNYYKLNLNIDVTYEYDAASPLIIKYTKKNLAGIATIKAKATSNNLLRANIDLQNALIADSVFVNNIKTTFTHASAKIDIDLMKSYAINELFTLTIYYHGTPGSSGFGSFVFGTHNAAGTKQESAIWSLSEPFGASDWFPCKDNPADKADSSDVWITAPKYYVSVSNGILEEKFEGTTTNTYKWKSRYPIANYLISIALTNYDYYRNDFNYGGVSPLQVDHYIFPEYNTPATKLLMDDTNFMVQLFTEKFGPYPFIKERYGHAMFGWGGGMEHQTCSSMVNLSSGLTAHELAHQWFGDKITCADWANIWLNEGFATYGALIYWEAKNGVADYKNKVISTMNGARNAVGSVYVQNPVSVGEIFNGNRSYNKGGIILHMLRRMVGDIVFYDILRTYAASPLAYGNATTEDFKQIAENVSGLDLDYFFDQWVYGQKYPKYQFGWAVVTNPGAKSNSSQATYTLKTQISQTINTPTPAFFTMPIALKVTFEDNTTQTVTAFNNAQVQSIDFTFAKKPTAVEFDPENGILKELTIVPYNAPLSLEEEPIKVALANEKDANFAKEIKFTISPNPAQNQAVIDFELKKPSHFNLQIVDLNGNSIYSFNETKLVKLVNHSISTNNYPTGQYFIRLNVGPNTLSRKLMVTH